MTDGATDRQFHVEWERVCGRMRTEIGEAAYRSWVAPMTVRSVHDGLARISVPTRFMRDWVVAHYADRLQSLWNEEDDTVRSVEIFIQSDRPAAPDEATPARRQAAKVPAKAATAANVVDQISAPLDTRFTFNNFVVGKPNEFAYAASRRIAEAQSVTFNPLFLYGGVGLGKTHLMHALAWHIRERDPSRTVIYISAEKFMYRFIRALREQNTVSFRSSSARSTSC